MKKIRMIYLFLLLAALLTVMTACNQTGTKQMTTNSGKEKIRIIYPTSRGMGQKDIAGLQEWFDKNYPNAELDMVSASVTTITDTVKSEIKNGNGADIFVTTDYDSFLEDGLLANITEMEAVHWFRKSSTSELERNDQLYALPIGGGTMVALHYNKELFKKYQIEEPKSDETFSELMARINKVIKKNELDIRAVNASMLYPAQVSVIYNSIFAEKTQSIEYLKWVLNYETNEQCFEDKVFQEYLDQISDTMIEDEELFSSNDFENSTASSIEKFLEGKSFVYVGDAKRCYETIKKDNRYDITKFAVVGIPSGIKDVSYVSYMDNLYLGISSDYGKFSSKKQEIIRELLTYIASGNDNIRNIFTFTGAYCSRYFEGESIETISTPYFEAINQCISHNYIAQEVSNVSYSSIFGKTLTAWRKGNLDDYISGEASPKEKVTKILEDYHEKGINAYAKSEETIGKSPTLMEYQSNLVRSQETAISNQVADMARSYMGTDFALINAGGIRASIPEGSVSVQTFNSVLPYENYLVKIRVSGATLKKALANAYNVGPLYKSGQFGMVSGLKVYLQTKTQGYEAYQQSLGKWEKDHPKADVIETNEAKLSIAQEICKNQEDKLNLELLKVTDEKGNEIQDDAYYTVATVDYLLKDQDGYSMLGVLSENKAADQSIQIYNKEDQLIEGTEEEKEKKIETTCKTGSECFADWVREGNELTSEIDGRLDIKNFIYIE